MYPPPILGRSTPDLGVETTQYRGVEITPFRGEIRGRNHPISGVKSGVETPLFWGSDQGSDLAISGGSYPGHPQIQHLDG